MTLKTPNSASTHPWTAAQDEQLRQMARQHQSLTEMARTLSRSLEDVAERLALVHGAAALHR